MAQEATAFRFGAGKGERREMCRVSVSQRHEVHLMTGKDHDDGICGSTECAHSSNTCDACGSPRSSAGRASRSLLGCHVESGLRCGRPSESNRRHSVDCQRHRKVPCGPSSGTAPAGNPGIVRGRSGSFISACVFSEFHQRLVGAMALGGPAAVRRQCVRKHQAYRITGQEFSRLHEKRERFIRTPSSEASSGHSNKGESHE
jgi:hypothetical protein